jgi:transcriptional regulator with XRE-family HTH domain
MKNNDKFGKMVMRIREGNGWTQQSIAEKANISRAQLSRIENGESGCTKNTKIAIARALGHEPSFFDMDGNELLNQPMATDKTEKRVIDAMRKMPDPIKVAITECFEKIADISSNCKSMNEVAKSKKPMFADADEF